MRAKKFMDVESESSDSENSPCETSGSWGLLKTSGNFVELECFGDLFDSHLFGRFWSLNLGQRRHSWCSPIALAEGLSSDKGSGWGCGMDDWPLLFVPPLLWGMPGLSFRFRA